MGHTQPHTEMCGHGGKAGGERSPEARQQRLWVPGPARQGRVSPFLPRSVTLGGHVWEKLCSQGRQPQGTEGLTQPCLLGQEGLSGAGAAPPWTQTGGVPSSLKGQPQRARQALP